MDIQTFSAIFILATLVEALIEHLVKPFLWPNAELEEAEAQTVHLSDNVRDIILRYLSAALGVGLCLAYKQDLLACAGLMGIHPAIGQVITGLVIGRGANYLHDLVSRWTPLAGTQPG